MRLPAVLGYSYDVNIEPKLAYLQEELGVSQATLREKVLIMPALLSYSLEKRYKPRVKLCRAAEVPVMMMVSCASQTDEKFKATVEARRRRTHSE